jgi:hypothetical protein
MGAEESRATGAATNGAVAVAGVQTAEEALRDHKIKSQINGAMVWLLMIGGFTLFNAVGWLTKQSLRMVIGLISTRLLTFQIVSLGENGRNIELAAAILAAVVFCGLAFLVYKRQMWALLVGIALYAADFVLFLVAIGTKDMMGLVFHGLATGALIGAYLTVMKLSQPAAPAAVAARTIPVEAGDEARD